jgi:hypothetical protein
MPRTLFGADGTDQRALSLGRLGNPQSLVRGGGSGVPLVEPRKVTLSVHPVGAFSSGRILVFFVFGFDLFSFCCLKDSRVWLVRGKLKMCCTVSAVLLIQAGNDVINRPPSRRSSGGQERP